ADRVVERDLGAVRDPVEVDLVDAYRAPDSLDVRHRLGRGVEAADRAEPRGAAPNAEVGKLVRAEVAAEELAGTPGAALVEHHEVAAVEGGIERHTEVR